MTRESTFNMPGIDPIFALIEAHKTAFLQREAFMARADFSDEEYEPIYDAELELQRRVFATKATSIPGLAAYTAHVLKCLAEYPDAAGRSWMAILARTKQ